MRRGRHHGLSGEQKAEIWQRWKSGESLHAIGRAFDKDHGSIQFLLSKHGGIAPAVRRRSQRTLTLAELEAKVTKSSSVHALHPRIAQRPCRRLDRRAHQRETSSCLA
jgi:hypothetical protein